MIEVLEPGFASTIQDLGRPGHMREGLAPSGAMDQYSYRLGNALVGNDLDAAVIEMTFLGPRLRFQCDAVIALTGADLPIFVNGEEVQPWAATPVKADDVVHFGTLRGGVRGYLSVSGGLDVPEYLGSRSTHTLVHLGGVEGRALVAGDVLALGGMNTGNPAVAPVPPADRPSFGGGLELRFVPGLFRYRLSDDGFTQLIERDWAITPNADRIGVRLSSGEERPLEFVPREQPFGAGSDPSNVVDAGYPVGAIQLPSGTEPIVLGRDALTAGGYATAGAVISADIDRLGQGSFREAVKFVPVSFEQATGIRNARDKHLHSVIERITS